MRTVNPTERTMPTDAQLDAHLERLTPRYSNVHSLAEAGRLLAHVDVRPKPTAAELAHQLRRVAFLLNSTRLVIDDQAARDHAGEVASESMAMVRRFEAAS